MLVDLNTCDADEQHTAWASEGEVCANVKWKAQQFGANGPVELAYSCFIVKAVSKDGASVGVLHSKGVGDRYSPEEVIRQTIMEIRNGTIEVKHKKCCRNISMNRSKKIITLDTLIIYK